MYRILYVDDDPGLLDIGKLFLEEKGQFSVDTSLSASAGLDLLALANYDAVISDYQMPGMDGIEFLKKVRTSGNTIPFILFTGRGREEVVIQALNEGADFYLQKGGEPVSQFTELAHKIRQSVQKRQAELMIRDHERREAEIINFLPDATFAIDTHGKVIAWNRAIEEMTGIPAGEIIGKADYEYALPFYHERRPVTVDLVLHDDPAVAGKYPVMKKDGNSRFSEIYIPHLNKGRGAHLWFTASPLYDTAGNLTGAIESIRDITERVRAKEALNLEKQRIESLLSLSRMDTWTDAEISTQVIEDAIRLTGSTIGYLATVNDDESVITMQNWSTSAHESCKIINKPIVYSVEKTGLWGEAVRQRKPVITNDYAAKNPLKRGTPDGHVPLVRHMNIPVFEGEHIVAVAGVGNKDSDYNEGDVHELQLLMQGWWQILVRKRAQEDIRRSNMILKTQQETSPDGILTVDEQRKILNYNQTFVAIWKIPVDLLATGTNEPVLRHMAGQVADPDTFLTRVQEVYDRKVAKSFEDLLLKDGRILEWFSAPMLGEKGEYFGRVWFFRDITRRKVDEDAVRAAQEKFSTIYLQSPDVIWISELESGRFIDVNDAAVRIFGYTRDEFIDKNSLDLGIWVNPEDRTILTQGIRKEGRVDRSGIILRRKNGENFHAECSASTIHIRGTEYLIITIRDISGMKRAQEALKESEEKFRLIVENSHDIIYTLTAKGVFIFVSPAWTTLLGHPVTQVTGHPFMEFVHPDDISGCMAFLRSVILKGQRQEGIEYRVKHRDGTWYWHSSSAVPLKDETGTIVGFYGIARDITEQKKAEEVLRKSEEKYRLIADNTADTIWIFDMDFRLRYISPSVEKMRGFTVEEAMALPLDRHMTPDSLAAVRCQFEKEMEQEKSRTEDPRRRVSFETEEYCRDGSTILVENSVTLLRDAAGRPTGILGISRDITRRKHADKALQESEQKFRENEQKFREIFNNINDGIELHEMREDGLPGKYLEVNEVICQMLGYTREELLQHSPLDFAIEYHNCPVEEIGREILTTGHSRFEAGHRNKDGVVIPVEVNAHLIVLHDKTMVLSVVRDITERKLAEETLKESEYRFRELFNSMNCGVAVYRAVNNGADFVFVDFNSGAETIEKTKKQDVIGRPVSEVFPSVIEFGIMDVFRRVWRSGESEHHPMSLYKDERISGWRENYIYRLPSGEVVAIYNDVTEHKQAEEALKDSEQKFREIFNNINDGIELHEVREDGLPGKYLEVNDVACRMLGYTREELLQHSPLDFAIEYHSRPHEEIGREILTTGHSRFETGHRNRYGGVIPVEINAHLIVLHDKTMVLSVVRDITERKLAEEILKESEEKYRELVENANSIILKLDTSGNVTFFNEFAQRFFGYTSDEIIGKHAVGTIVPDTESESGRNLRILLDDIVRHPGTYLFNENENTTRDGKRVWIQWQNKPLLDQNEQLAGVLCIGTDITARRQAEVALRKAHDDLEIRVQERTADLRESEERLKLKLDSILMDNTDISDLELINILDIPKIQSMMDDFSRLTCMVTAIVDLKGNVIESSGWQDICTKFHRVNKQSAGFCIECDLYLARNLKPGQYVEYKCRNNLRDVVTPLFIGDKHVGNVYTGQFFYDDEIIDDTIFIAQAEEFGFDREKYMAALRSVPRFSHEQINHLMDYLVKLSGFISRLSYSNLKLAGAMTGQKQVQDELQTLYDELDKRVIERTAELSRAQAAYKQANKKLNLLSGITRHDINNQLLVARGFLKKLHQKIPDPAYEKEFTRIEEAWSRIFGMIQFTKHYEQIGVSAPVWQNCRTLVDTAVKDISPGNVLVKNDLPENTEVFADPLIVKVFYNLVDNALQYGIKITKIQFSLQESADGCCIICEDDGAGILPEDKERIFDRGFGKNTGMGLYLAREILSITNITIAETGEPGKGARFEINVPKEAWRNSKGE